MHTTGVRRHLYLLLLALTAAVGLTGCPETDRDRNLHIANETSGPIQVTQERDGTLDPDPLTIPAETTYLVVNRPGFVGGS